MQPMIYIILGIIFLVLFFSILKYISSNNQEEEFSEVDEMPIFGGCEKDDLDKEQLTQCSNKKLIEFVHKNIVYPKLARELGIEGKVMIKFVIDEKGKVTDAEIEKDIYADCGKEALRIVNMMPNWTPGKFKNKPVRVLLKLPVSFQLTDKEPS